MDHQTIDREEILMVFHDLMKPNASRRILHLMGDAKMGKSHLLNKIFPGFIRRTHADCAYAILDLRNQSQNVPEVLYDACGQLGDRNFREFFKTYESWHNRPKVEVSRFTALFSKVKFSAQSNEDMTRPSIPGLTLSFVNDLRSQFQQPVLLLFDAVDTTSEFTRNWLMHSLLVQIHKLPHVRCVIAGRSLPPAVAGYAEFYDSYELLPIRTDDAYIRYCQEQGLTLVEQSIRDFARASNYCPGLFVEYLYAWRSRGYRD